MVRGVVLVIRRVSRIHVRIKVRWVTIVEWIGVTYNGFTAVSSQTVILVNEFLAEL